MVSEGSGLPLVEVQALQQARREQEAILVRAAAVACLCGCGCGGVWVGRCMCASAVVCVGARV